MSVTQILEYQKIDMHIYKKENELSKSEEMKRLNMLKNDVKVKNDALNGLVKDLEICYKQLSVQKSKLNEAQEYGKTFDIDFDEFTEIKEFDKFEKDLLKYEETINSIVKEINRLIKKISDINAENNKLNDLIDKRIIEFNKAKEACKAKQSDLLKEAFPYAKQLKALEPDIDPKLLTKYKELRTKRKMPAFVMYMDGNCLGCGMEISVEVDKILKNAGDCTECPHCGRIVYKNS